MKKVMTVTLLFMTFAAQVSMADICDYTPSNLLGKEASAVASVSSGAAVATGAGMKVAGLYTITHATSGAVMLGSTAVGSSAAGTVGIIAGSAGFWGTLGAVLMSPLFIVPTAVALVGASAYEGGCYLAGDEAVDEKQ